jgi:hypothetical protein
MGVVNQHPEHVHWPRGLLPHALGDAKGVDYAVAVTPRRDLENFHGSVSSLRGWVFSKPQSIP